MLFQVRRLSHCRKALISSIAVGLLSVPLASAQLNGFPAGTATGTYTGPTSSATPYVNPSAPGWEVISLITVGDKAEENGYTMVGIPDGLGALAGRFEPRKDNPGMGPKTLSYVDQNKYMTVVMDHELGSTLGAVRAHGATGAFVSQWTIDLDSLEVEEGQDLIRDLYLWNTAAGGYVLSSATDAARLQRLCSADLAAEGAYYNKKTRWGFDGRIFLSGEENSNGRAFAHVLTGDEKGSSWELPHMGRLAWENAVAHPDAGNKTLVVGLDDSTPGQVYLYVGDKKAYGNPAEQAGLVGGALYGIKVTNGGANYSNAAVTRENQGAINGTFTLQNVSDVAVGPGSALETASVARGITAFARPEDGAWDTQNPLAFYFVVTGGVTLDEQLQTARLYKLTFNSLTNPTGGAIELVLDRASLSPNVYPGGAQFDNITVDQDGRVLVQEDPGNVPYFARTWEVNPQTGVATEILVSDPDRFVGTSDTSFNQDEENSGIIEVTDLVKHARWFENGRRYFLADMQAHYDLASPLIEGGQLYLVASPRAAEKNK